MRIAAALLLTLPAILQAQNVAIAEYPANGAGCAITAGPDDALWFTEATNNKVARITTAGVVTEYALPTDNAFPCGIATGMDGALWFTEGYSNKIGRITTGGAIAEYPVPTAGSNPTGITAGPDGALWFAEYSANKIGRITTAGAITEYALATEDPLGPEEITTGPDGALWFTYPYARIGRITTAGEITVYTAPPKTSYPSHITTGPDGALWFTESDAGQIGRITTGGAISEYPLPNSKCQPTGITSGPDGALWFTEYKNSKIGRITTAGAITEYPVPLAGIYAYEGRPQDIVTGPDGELWFTEGLSSAIGQVVFTTANLSATPDSGYFHSDLTFSGSGFMAYDNVQIYDQGVGSRVLAGAAADGSGSFTTTAQAPESPYGPRVFLGKAWGSGRLAAANFSILAHLVLQPDSGAAGSAVTIVGYGFGPNELVEIYWNDLNTNLGVAQTDIHGTFAGSRAFTFSVPAGATAGVYSVLWQGHSTKARGAATFTVD